MTRGAEIRADRVAIYIRWSTDDQTEGTTLAVQQEGCEHYVLSQGWRVTPSLIFVDDGYSGGSLDRPKLGELRTAVTASQVDCVVVYKLDRLSRSVIDTVNLVLDEWEGLTYVKSAREPIDTTSPMGKQFFYMLVSYAEWERNVIKERTHSGKMKRVQEGHYWGGPVPYGYRPAGHPGLLEVDPDKAQVVRRVFERYMSEVGTQAIAQELNRDGVPGPQSDRWTRVTVRLILRNPIYAGQLKYAKTTSNPRYLRNKSEPRILRNASPVMADSQFPAIITRGEFVRVQELMASRQPQNGVRALASEHLLTGLLRCQCSGTMNSHAVQDGQHYYDYYRCSTKMEQGSSVCHCGSIPQHVLDEHVETALRELLKGQDAYNQFVTLRWATVEAQLQEMKQRHQQAEKRVSQLNAEVTRLNQDYRKGLSMDLYQENRKEIDAELAQVKEQLVYLERQEQSLAAQLQERDSMKEVFDLARRWNDISIPQRKYILRNLVDKVVAYRVPRSEEITAHIEWKFAGAQAIQAPESPQGA